MQGTDMWIASPCRDRCSTLLVECAGEGLLASIKGSGQLDQNYWQGDDMLMILKHCNVVDDGILTEEQTRHTPGKACAWGFAAYCGTCCE